VAPQRDWFEKDYYAVLGVPETASQKEITKAYRKLARETHPDANPGSEERFKEVSAAYDVVGDPEKRKEYDEVRKLGPVGAGFGGPSGGGGAGPFGGGGFRVEDLGDIGDIFGGLFNRRGRGGGGGAPRGAGPQRGADLEATLTMPFDDAVHGAMTTLADAPCPTCHGTGAEPGTTPLTCPVCEGRGVVDEDQGLFSFSSPCRNCGGRGVLIETPCHTCHGSGAVRRPRNVKVRIPPGVEDGARIRLKGRGAPGRNSGPAGDLYVEVHVADHPLFGRKGDDLTVSLPVTFPEAALGADVKVPTLEGTPVTLRIPPGTRSGRTFRVKGRGVPAKRRTGDLLVTVEVAVPASLSDAERRAVEDLAAASDGSPRAHLGVER
jgi:molecular chaperone DnaJ